MSDDISIMIRRLVDERDEWKAKHDDIAATLALERRYARDDRTMRYEWKERYEAAEDENSRAISRAEFLRNT